MDYLLKATTELRDRYDSLRPAVHSRSSSGSSSLANVLERRDSQTSFSGIELDTAPHEIVLLQLEEAEALQVEVFVEAGLLYSVAQHWAKAESSYEQVLHVLEEYDDMGAFVVDILLRLGLIALNRGHDHVRLTVAPRG